MGYRGKVCDQEKVIEVADMELSRVESEKDMMKKTKNIVIWRNKSLRRRRLQNTN